MKTSLGRPTKYEQERIDAMRRLGCVACAQLGVPNLNELELHHILDGNVRLGHWFTIFLCAGHHQGRWNETQKEWISPDLRVAIADGRKRFNRVYPAEKLLWVKVQQRLKLSDAWPPSKLVPRKQHANAELFSDVVEIPQSHHGDAVALPMGLEASVPPPSARGATASAEAGAGSEAAPGDRA